MKAVLFVSFMVCFYVGGAQTYFRSPLYSFTGRVAIGTGNVADSSAYLTVGPLGPSVKGLRLPRIADTAAITGTKRMGLTAYLTQKSGPAWYDSIAGYWKAFGGETNTMSSAGGTSLYKSKTGVNFDLKGITAGSGITVTGGTNDVVIKADTSLLATITDVSANYSESFDTLTLNANAYSIKDDVTAYIINSVSRHGTLITINATLYVDSASFVAGTTFDLGTVPTNFRPNSIIAFALPDRGLGGVFESRNGSTAFTGDYWNYTGAMAYVKQTGVVIVTIRTITFCSRLYGNPYVIIPINISYNIYDNS